MGLASRLIGGAAVAAALAGAAFWFLTAPERIDGEQRVALAAGDPVRGEQVFWAGGCASCHAAPGATGEARLQLGGGERLETPFGTFVAPNISSDPRDGIGQWSTEDLANAMLKGVSPGGSHYYPAFPYTSYARMQPSDISDLHAFMKTLPAVAGKAPPHEIGFPYNLRRGLGLWKRLYLDPAPVVSLAEADEQVLRGQYLVEGPGHCGECHTPRDVFGGIDRGRWLAGGPSPEGRGSIPNITPGGSGFGAWSVEDIANYLETGFTPEFDSAGGKMASVVQNMANLPASDREAIAAYLKAIPEHADE